MLIIQILVKQIISHYLEIISFNFVAEPNCKEPEMQIGFPTDVKHVAHIGWDGPSTTAPSWVSFFFFLLLNEKIY